MDNPNASNEERHILGLSGGKDSAALALYMAEKYPELDIEYFFTDTGSELPEVYEYLDKLETQLRKPIARLRAKEVNEVDAVSGQETGESIFGEIFKNVYHGFLPSPQSRWCTVQMKLKPMERWLAPTLEAGGRIVSYIAIRSDEDRLGYNPPNPAITPKFPFVEDGIDIFGVHEILDAAMIGKPAYYDWRSRSGCTFCFYQQKIEWVGLLEKHPDKYKEAVEFEKYSMEASREKGRSAFTWSQGETLEDLAKPDRVKKIQADYEKRVERHKKRRANPLHEGLCEEEISVDELYDTSLDISVCVVCHK
tara:strand:- start:9379 stop:10302 length:924 start_codon:yes stop_codon:yes gene_type:complete